MPVPTSGGPVCGCLYSKNPTILGSIYRPLISGNSRMPMAGLTLRDPAPTS